MVEIRPDFELSNDALQEAFESVSAMTLSPKNESATHLGKVLVLSIMQSKPTDCDVFHFASDNGLATIDITERSSGFQRAHCDLISQIDVRQSVEYRFHRGLDGDTF